MLKHYIFTGYLQYVFKMHHVIVDYRSIECRVSLTSLLTERRRFRPFSISDD